MGILESIGAWLLEFLLKYLVNRAVQATQDKLADIEEDRRRGIVNSANQKAYEAALDREARRKHALNLINRIAP